MKIYEGLKVNTLTLFVVKYLEKKVFFRIVQRDDEVRLLGAPVPAGLRLAYMAQRAFHRLEKYKQETSLQYTM